MSDTPQVPRYFLGANSSHGFASLFESVYSPTDGWRVFFLKGGPGSGKSTLMKRCAQAMLEHDEEVELVFCSSDPKSLDAVILPKRRLYLADATAPHVLEPKFPGACETLLNPGDCWNTEKLFTRRDSIFRLNACIARKHRRSRQLLSAAGALLTENRNTVKDALRTEALHSYAQRLGKRLFPRKAFHAFRPAVETQRFLSGITPDGLLSFDPTLSFYAEKILLIDDEYGPASTLLLEDLRQIALRSGYPVIVCPCPLFPEEKLDALICPELSLAFAVANRFHRRESVTPMRVLHLRRFLDLHRLSADSARLRLDRKNAHSLISEATGALAEARSLHDELERIYISAMDFSKLDRFTGQLITELRQML